MDKGDGGEQSGLYQDAYGPEMQSLPEGDLACQPDVDPSPPEASGLLSLPWEMVTYIASHLPAHCVISVLPKVCSALRNVGKDSTAWQLRARRLIGSKVNFPVGRREDFDWPTACLEMEQLITCWTDMAQHDLRHHQAAEEEDQGDQGRVEMEPGRDAQGVDERLVGELVGELEQRLGDNPEEDALFEGHDGALDHQQAQPGNGEIIQHQPPRSSSPPPALERLTLLAGHIAQVNSVLLLGGDGTLCATGSRDRNVNLWKLHADSSSVLLHTLLGSRNFSTHQGWVWCLASQGPLLASGGFDSTVRLWDLQASGAEKGLIKAGGAVLCLTCLPDVLLAGTFDERVSVYDPRAAFTCLKSLRLHTNAVMCLAADDKYIVSAGKDCTVAVYDRRADKTLNKVRLNAYLRSMSYSDSEVWGGDHRGTLHSFAMRDGLLKSTAHLNVGHTAMITGIHKSPGSLYTCSSDCTVKVHIPCRPPKTLCTLRHQAGASGLSVEAGTLAVASGDMGVEIWRPRKS
ncbi:F-box/WD repeat-containing protein 9-like [Entelurus aequoreus]|uniref:F-box/WD repeat-containing protein 9-like n=1 Tax=Entelurus aequoreus TaxID=161455 RepID=UPI002B1D06DE|nr:F-box/WD repeat-containing protein 9-like [Entelurus aequoreus]